MNFYSSIADYYDYIFPFKPVQRDFVLSFYNDEYNASLLDIGCGTGGLLISLADHFEKLVGIDPDEDMLRLSRLKAQGSRLKRELEFLPLGMLDLEENFDPASFDMILCFGNTLVHLGSEEEVGQFLNQAKRVLKPGGKLLIQIINYDLILDEKREGLPTIENDKIRFERVYKYSKNPVTINFNTTLTIKSTGQIIKNSVPLLAMRPGKLREMISKAGFKDIEEFGDFKGDAFTENSQPYILKA